MKQATTTDRRTAARSRRVVAGVLGLAVLALMPEVLMAQVAPPVAPTPTTAMDNIASSFRGGSAVWLGRLSGIAQRLFVVLAGIEIAISGLLWILRRDALDEIAGRFLLKFIVLSFMLMLITAFGYWLPPILNGFAVAGEQAIGRPTVSPSDIVDTGVRLSASILNGVKYTGLLETMATMFFAVATALIVEVAYVLIAAMVLLAWIEGYIVLGGGVLFLGFAAFRGTASLPRASSRTCSASVFGSSCST